jgi:hypothetical protein
MGSAESGKKEGKPWRVIMGSALWLTFGRGPDHRAYVLLESGQVLKASEKWPRQTNVRAPLRFSPTDYH